MFDDVCVFMIYANDDELDVSSRLDEAQSLGTPPQDVERGTVVSPQPLVLLILPRDRCALHAL